MKNTYLNDNNTTVFPFASNTELPFSRSCILGCGLSILYKSNTMQGRRVKISSISITEKSIYATFNLECADNTVIVLDALKTDSISGYGTLSKSFDDFDVMIWVKAATNNINSIGTYVQDLYIDPVCVTVLDKSYNNVFDTLYVNKESFIMPTNLVFKFSGYFDTTLKSSNNSTTQFEISANIPEDAITSSQDTVTSYDMVTSISGTNIKKATNYSTTLRLITKTPENTLDTDKDYIAYYFDNAQRESDIDKNINGPDTDLSWNTTPNIPRLRYGINLNDDFGDATILTIVGKSKILNCYNPEIDEADNVD